LLFRVVVVIRGGWPAGLIRWRCKGAVNRRGGLGWWARVRGRTCVAAILAHPVASGDDQASSGWLARGHVPAIAAITPAEGMRIPDVGSGRGCVWGSRGVGERLGDRAADLVARASAGHARPAAIVRHTQTCGGVPAADGMTPAPVSSAGHCQQPVASWPYGGIAASVHGRGRIRGSETCHGTGRGQAGGSTQAPRGRTSAARGATAAPAGGTARRDRRHCS
jgi:hypothetical protein